jgi:hypothetical protein
MMAARFEPAACPGPARLTTREGVAKSGRLAGERGEDEPYFSRWRLGCEGRQSLLLLRAAARAAHRSAGLARHGGSRGAERVCGYPPCPGPGSRRGNIRHPFGFGEARVCEVLGADPPTVYRKVRRMILGRSPPTSRSRERMRFVRTPSLAKRKCCSSPLAVLSLRRQV